MKTPLQAKAKAPARPTPTATLTRGNVLQRKCACGGTAGPTGECESCRKKRLQRKADGREGESETDSAVPPIIEEVLRSPGQPLGGTTREFMERRFAHNFGQVRLHTDRNAAESARAIDALAYTVGHHVIFGAGAYSPDSLVGRETIAHELTHVVQQTTDHPAGNGVATARDRFQIDPDARLERHATEMAARVIAEPAGAVRWSIPSNLPKASSAIQRQRANQPRAPLRAENAAVVEDNWRVAPGQMRRSEFVSILRDELIQGCDRELTQFGRTARGCPYILRTLERYAHRPVSSLMRLLDRFAHPAPGADADAIIRAVSSRARAIARRLGQRYGERVQAKSDGRNVTSPRPEAVAVRRQLGNGERLGDDVRGRMENAFGVNFSAVRIHNDAEAANLNAELGARAFAIGAEIAFAAGEYRPGTVDGDTLIAHELAHTVQQDPKRRQTIPAAGEEELEREADRAAAIVTSARNAQSSQLGTSETRVQRWPVIVAGALIIAEATPEAVVIAELSAVSTEIVVADGALVLAADVAAPVAIEALEFSAPAVLEGVAPVVADATIVSSSSAFSTAAAATAIGATTTLVSDTPAERDRRDRRCPVVPLCPHRGPNTNRHHDCADNAPPNVYRGCDAFVALGFKAFDALDPAGRLWEIKTGNPAAYPDFLQTPQATGITAGLLEIESENEIARACNRPFILGVTSAAARLWYSSRLPDIDVRVITC